VMSTDILLMMPRNQLQGPDGRTIQGFLERIRQHSFVVAQRIFPASAIDEASDHAMEFDVACPLPPKRRYSVGVSIRSVRKAVPRGGDDAWDFEENVA
jgi:hypothetical protein